jgi:amidohydrolase
MHRRTHWKRHALLVVLAAASQSQAVPPAAKVDEALRAVDARIIAWRRDIHRNPELSNREFRTAKLVAEHLKSLGLEVQTGIAHTGVVGVLRGGRPGATIALRADMDALPVTERTDVPFRSQATTEYRGEKVGVMHACGHDVHTANLMGVAEALSKMRADIPGTIVFVFQPAEEGAPAGEKGGAQLMIEEGLFEKYRPAAVFGLHVMSTLRAGEIGYRVGPFMAASDSYRILVTGRQTHGSRPWLGVDPIVTAAQIVNALQTIVSRQVDITTNPAVVTVGAIKGGIRNNIIPENVEMIGTFRTFTEEQREQVIAAIERTVASVAQANGATASFELNPDGNPVTSNDPALTQRMLASLQRAAGEDNVRVIPLVTGAEDFAYYGRKVPSLFFHVGITPADRNPLLAPSNHSDLFYVDERGIPLATRALVAVALDYLAAHAAPGT